MKSLYDGIRLDGMLNERDLEAIDNELYRAPEEELIARTFLNVKTDIDPGAETYGYDQYTRAGSAKRTPTGADDIPLVDGDKTRKTQKIISIEDGFKIEKQELRAARKAGMAVETNKAEDARRVVAEDENDLIFLGDSSLGTEGLVNASGINTYDVPQDSDTDGTEWTYKTGAEIITDIREARKKVNANDGYNVDTLILPPDQYQELEKPYNQYNANSIMAYLMEQGWFDRILEISYLEEADPAGANDCGLVLDTTPAYMELGLPMDIDRDDPYRLSNGAFQVNLEERTCGLILRRPLAVCRFDLI